MKHHRKPLNSDVKGVKRGVIIYTGGINLSQVDCSFTMSVIGIPSLILADDVPVDFDQDKIKSLSESKYLSNIFEDVNQIFNSVENESSRK